MITNPLLDYKKKGKEFKIDDLPKVHHMFMKHYGWIPVEQFRTMPIKTLFILNKLVQEEERKSEELRLCTLKFYGVKKPK